MTAKINKLLLEGAEVVRSIGAGGGTLLTTDFNVLVTAITGGGDTITLPVTGLTAGATYRIYDSSGGAATNNITIDPTGATTINGAATVAIDTDYGNITCVWTGTEWIAEVSSGGAGITNLSLGTVTGTTVDVNSSTGTNATLVAANATDAGLMLAADKVILDNITSSSQTLTNKSIDGDTNTITNIGLAEFDVDTSDVMEFVDGTYLDSPSVTVASNGTVITLSFEKSGTGDVRVIFTTGVTIIDCTPIATVALTAGTDISPMANYVYIPASTGVLTASTSGWPTAEHAAVATVFCQSAASLQTYGAYKVHAWTNHLSNGNGGHLNHINYWIRKQPATWEDGVLFTPTITVVGGGMDTIDYDTTVGTVLQLHDHTFPVLDSTAGDSIYITNNSTAPYTRTLDLADANETSAGVTITNGKYTNLVIWGCVSQASADCKLFVNQPSAFHASSAAAIADAESYANYSIPVDFIGAGFLIARLTLKYTAAGSGTWELTENKDLRGVTISGGGVAFSAERVDSVFRIVDDGDSTKKIAFQASGITTATTRTITMGDADVTLSDLAKTVGDQTFTNDVVVSETLRLDAEYDNGTVTGATAIVWGNGNFQKVTIGASLTLSFTAPASPATLRLKIVQSAASWTTTLPTILWPRGSAPTISTTLGAIDIISIYYDGTSYYGSFAGGFA
jgi:hypothetical protein